MASHAARQAAYAELVAGLLDVGDESAQERFDVHVQQLVKDGLMTPEVARSVRLMQRQSVRAVVEHAQVVLPVTLLALEQSHREQWLAARMADDEIGEDKDADRLADQSSHEVTDDRIDDRTDDLTDELTDDTEAHDGPVDLTARRLLVAGLTLLPDP